MKTDNTYKMSKALKTKLALGQFKSAEQRSSFKRNMKNSEQVFKTTSYAVMGGKSE